MRLGLCTFSENDFNKFLYFNNNTFIQNATTWLNRLIHLIPAGTWINSEKVIAIISEEKKRNHQLPKIYFYFENAKLNMEQKAKIGKIFDEYVNDIKTKISPFTNDYLKISGDLHPCVSIIHKAIYGTLKWKDVNCDDEELYKFIERTNNSIKNPPKPENFKQLIEQKIIVDELMKFGRWKDYSLLKILRKIVEDQILSEKETELLNQRLYPFGASQALDEFIKLNPRVKLQTAVD